MNYTNFRFFDLETMPNDKRVKEFCSLFPPKPDSRIKDPDKVAANVAKKSEDIAAKAALEPRLSEVLTIQYATLDKHKVEVICGGTESERLKTFWDLFQSSGGATFVNWTGTSDSSNWDLNMLFRRSIALGLFIPEEAYPNAAGRATSRWLDLAPRFLAYEKWPASASLEKAAWEFGIQFPDVAPVTGATFWKFWTGQASDIVPEWSVAQMRAAAERYCTADVLVLRELFHKLTSF